MVPGQLKLVKANKKTPIIDMKIPIITIGLNTSYFLIVKLVKINENIPVVAAIGITSQRGAAQKAKYLDQLAVVTKTPLRMKNLAFFVLSSFRLNCFFVSIINGKYTINAHKYDTNEPVIAEPLDKRPNRINGGEDPKARPPPKAHKIPFLAFCLSIRLSLEMGL